MIVDTACITNHFSWLFTGVIFTMKDVKQFKKSTIMQDEIIKNRLSKKKKKKIQSKSERLLNLDWQEILMEEEEEYYRRI